jgi:hypothetical protein
MRGAHCSGEPGLHNVCPLEFELGSTDGRLLLFTKALEIGGEYEFETDLDSLGHPTLTIYRPKTGYHCEDLTL